MLGPGPGQTQQQLGQGFMVIIAELEARSHLLNNPNSALAAVTEISLSSGLSKTSEPGFSNSSQHPQSMCCKETSAWSLRGNGFTLQDISAISCSVQNWTSRNSGSQSEQCYRREFAFPSCSDWRTAEGRIVWTASYKPPAVLPGILGVGA